MRGLPRRLSSEEPSCNTGDAGDTGSIPGSGRRPGGGHDNPYFLAWKIPWTEEPDLLHSMGLQSQTRLKQPGMHTGSVMRMGLPCSRFGSVQFSRSVMSDSLRPHELQHTRRPCPSPTPGAYSNSCPLSWCCHPTISFSIVPFSSCLQACPASGSFPMSQLFAPGGQRIGVSVSASVLPMNIQD